jgi:hypothetical protein
MSRKFLDDNVELEAISGVPTNTSGYGPGHQLVSREAGVKYVNEGDTLKSIWAHPLANRYELIEKFQRAPLLNASVGVAANLDFEILGTNAANAGSTFATGGGVTLTTTTAANDQVIIVPHLTTKQTAWTGVSWATDDAVVFETNIKTGASIALTTIWAGLKLTNTSVVATDDDQVFVRYNSATASGIFQFITSNNNTDTTTATSITVAAATAYHIKIVIAKTTRVPVLYINGEKVATGSALRTAINLIPYIGVQTTTTAAKSITVRGLRVSKNLT